MDDKPDVLDVLEAMWHLDTPCTIAQIARAASKQLADVSEMIEKDLRGMVLSLRENKFSISSAGVGVLVKHKRVDPIVAAEELGLFGDEYDNEL